MTIERGRTIVYSDHIVTEQCWVCGVWFGLASSFVREANIDGRTFHCPNGDKLRYGTPTITKLQAELDQAKARAADERRWRRQETERAEAIERSRRAIKGQLTKVRKRAAAALCPVPGCKRQIVQMERHLSTVHAGWVAEHHHERGDDL